MDKQGGEGTSGGPEVGINNTQEGQKKSHLARTKKLRKGMIENMNQSCHLTSRFPRDHTVLPCLGGNLRPITSPSTHMVQMRAAFLLPGHCNCEGDRVTQTPYPTSLVMVTGPWMGTEPRQDN